MKKSIIVLVTLFSLFLAACSNTDKPLILQTGADAEKNATGLVRVNNSKLDMSFAKPGINWSKYTKLYFAHIGADNKHPKGYQSPKIDRFTNGPNATYNLRTQDLEKLASEYRKVIKQIFNDEQPWQLVDFADKNTLIVEIYITDIRLSAPREDSRRNNMQMGGRTYTQNTGSMVLLAQLKDGISGELLAESADRGTTIDQWKLNTKVFNLSDVRTIFRSWNNAFKNALMQVHANSKEK